jgi:IclR family acetate operon transcriptional repressor
VFDTVNDVQNGERTAATVPAVERAIRVLQALAEDGDGRGLSELSRQLGVSKSTLSGVLATLERHRLVERDAASRTFRLGVGLLDLSGAVLGRLDVREAARPFLVELRNASGETAILHVRSADEPVILDRAEPDRELKVVAPLGRRLPPFAGSVAKALLAELPAAEAEVLVRAHPLPVFTLRSIAQPTRYLKELARVRRDGYALDDEEYLPGVRAASASLSDRRGRAIGTLSVVGVSVRLESERLHELGPQVAAAAAAVSRRLGAAEAV